MVLKIDPNDFSNTSYPFGNATWFTLKTSRLGAGATWVVGKGLVVFTGCTSSGIADPAVLASTYSVSLRSQVTTPQSSGVTSMPFTS